MLMSKVLTMHQAIAEYVPDGASVALGLQMEQMIPFAAGHEIIRQKKRGLRLIGPISDILFDQLIGAGCVKDVVAAWVGNVMMGSAYNFSGMAEVVGRSHHHIANPGRNYILNAARADELVKENVRDRTDQTQPALFLA